MFVIYYYITFASWNVCFVLVAPAHSIRYSVGPRGLLFVAMSMGYPSSKTSHAICYMKNNKHTFCIMLKVKSIILSPRLFPSKLYFFFSS
jgi:hypothetical protein